MGRASNAGVIYMLFAAVLFGISDIAIKVLGGNLSPWQITTGRGLFGMLMVMAALKGDIRPLLIRHWPIQLGLGLSGAMGFTCFIFSIKYLPLSISLPLAYIYPAIGALLSPLINKEKPTSTDWLAIGLAVTAVVCLSQGSAPEAGRTSAAGIAYGLIGACFVALMVNLARRQTLSVPIGVNLFYLCLGNFSFCLPFLLLFDRPIIPPTTELGPLFLILAPASILGFFVMFIAYRSISAFRGGTIMILEAAIACFYGVVMLGEPLAPLMVMGGLLMVSSALIVTKSNASAVGKKLADAV